MSILVLSSLKSCGETKSNNEVEQVVVSYESNDEETERQNRLMKVFE